jgi:hypothetical protein|tara:strand:+ start:225 stop:773 length:549 start_codon:yes stop_codon:yes gene_type:complete
MSEHVSTSVNFGDAVHSIKFRENGRNLLSYFFHVDQKIEENIGDLLKFYTIWEAARSSDHLPRWNTSLLEQLSEWHQFMRISHIGPMIKPAKCDLANSEKLPQTMGAESPDSLKNKVDYLSLKNQSKYREYLRYIYKHHYVISVGTTPFYDGGTLPIILMSLPLAENGKDVTHFLSAVTPMS